MPRNEVTCAIPGCSHRIEGKKRSFKVSQPSLKPKLDLFIAANNLELGPSGVICTSCHGKVYKPHLNSPNYREQIRRNRMQAVEQRLVNSDDPGSHVIRRSDRNNFVNASQSSVSTSATTVVSTSQAEAFDSAIDDFTDAEAEPADTPINREDQVLTDPPQRNESTPRTSHDSNSSTGASVEENTHPTDSQSLVSQTVHSDSSESQISSISSSTKIANYVELPGTTIIKGNDKRCFICPIQPNPQPELSRSRLPKEAQASMFYSDKIFVSSHLRCCPKHLKDGEFTDEAKAVIQNLPPKRAVLINELEDWVNNAAKTKILPNPFFDFTRGTANYVFLTSLDRTLFEKLHSMIEGRLRNSANRDTRQVLASFLILLRTGQAQQLIGMQLGMDQHVVSDAIESAANALYDIFVPQYLGYNHMAREEALKSHNRQTCFDIPEDKMAVVIDGTYLFKDKPGNIQEQIDSYSGQKKQNFDRYAVVVMPSGYCVDVVGPFPAKVNDAECLSTMLEDEDFVEFLGDGAHFFVDRGYRDCIHMLKENGYVPHVPDFLAADQNQFTAQQANHSRKVTKTRWVVEAKNGQFKKVLNFFMGRIHGGYKAKTPKFFKIAMALLNFSRPVPYTESDRSVQMVHKIRDIADANAPNALKEKIEVLQCLDLRCKKWTKINATDYPDFPTIDSLEQFQDEITLGSYQCNIASRYIDEHVKADGDFTIMVHECIGNIVRAQIKSRMSQPGKDFATFVEYDPELIGADAIIDTWCQCIQGQRQAGCCAHVATVLRYMMYDRHHPTLERQRRKRQTVQYLDTTKIKKPKLDVAGPSKPKSTKKQAPKSLQKGKSKRKSTASATQARTCIESLNDGQSDAEAGLDISSQ